MRGSSARAREERQAGEQADRGSKQAHDEVPLRFHDIVRRARSVRPYAEGKMERDMRRMLAERDQRRTDRRGRLVVGQFESTCESAT